MYLRAENGGHSSEIEAVALAKTQKRGGTAAEQRGVR